MSDRPRIVLAYSGGLDTSIILRWLQQEHGAEVVAFTADIGQGAELESARTRAQALGVKLIFVEDLCEEFVREYVYPMFRANALYEGEYLLGTAIARPLIAKRLAEVARETEAVAVAHGATGKGNDQLRFELGIAALDPTLAVIAPWREWQLQSRQELLAYARQHGIDVDGGTNDTPPCSIDANLLHVSYEGGILEDPWVAPEAGMWQRTVAPEQAQATAAELLLEFHRGDAVALNGNTLRPAALLTELNRLGGMHGIGRVDLVENRYIGMKSRGCYETPGGTILLKAHRAMESLTLDREVAHLKDGLMPRYAELIYNGYWWSPERQALQQLIDATQHHVSGEVRLKIYRGNVIVSGRRSAEHSLYRQDIATFEAGADYDQRDAGGFINLQALRLRLNRQLRLGSATPPLPASHPDATR